MLYWSHELSDSSVASLCSSNCSLLLGPAPQLILYSWLCSSDCTLIGYSSLLSALCADPVIPHTHCWLRFSFTSVQHCTFRQINNTIQSWGFLGFYYEWNTLLSAQTHTMKEVVSLPAYAAAFYKSCLTSILNIFIDDCNKHLCIRDISLFFFQDILDYFSPVFWDCILSEGFMLP